MVIVFIHLNDLTFQAVEILAEIAAVFLNSKIQKS